MGDTDRHRDPKMEEVPQDRPEIWNLNLRVNLFPLKGLRNLEDCTSIQKKKDYDLI